DAAGKAGTASSAQTGGFNFVDDVFTPHRHRFAQFLVTAVAQITVDVGSPIFTSDVFENETVFERVRGRLRFAVRLLILQKLGDGIWVYVLVERIVDHADRRGSAVGQALDKLNAVIPVGANRYRRMHSFLTALARNAGGRAEILHQLVAPGHGTAERAANTNVRTAGGFEAEHRIKRNELENIDRLQIQLGRDPVDDLVVDKVEVVLPQMQQRHGGGSAAGGRGG